MIRDPDTQQQQRHWAGALAITTLCVQYITFLMAQPTRSEKANWNDQEILGLVNYLHDHRAEARDGGTFKPPAYNAAVAHIAPHLTQGPVKTGKMCKTKWTLVRRHVILLYRLLTAPASFQLKQIHAAIETYRSQSGFHWDNENGANIVGDAAAAVWTTYTQQKVCDLIDSDAND
jgi:hypothetical protein